MLDEKLDDHRSPAPDAAPEDNPEPDALKDVDIKSGTGNPPADSERAGVAGPAAGTTEGDDAVGVV
jgi:hypothetical protein